jgi:hypothetical protein
MFIENPLIGAEAETNGGGMANASPNEANENITNETPEAVETNLEHLREPFLSKLKEDLLAEHLTISELNALVGRAYTTISAPDFSEQPGSDARLLDDELTGGVVDSYYFRLMTEKTDRVTGMPIHYGLRGYINDRADTDFESFCLKVFRKVDDVSGGLPDLATESRTIEKRLAQTGLIRSDIYEALKSVRDQTRALKEADREQYARDVLESYLERWSSAEGGTADDFIQLATSVPKIKDMKIADFVREIDGFSHQIGNNNSALIDYRNVFSFLNSLPRRFGPEVADLPLNFIFEFLNYKETVRKVSRGRSYLKGQE